MTRFYVAAKTHDYLRARALMVDLRSSGNEVTFDWTYNVEEVGPDHENEAARDGAFLLKCAIDDVYGVKTAQHVVAIGHPKACGTLVEIGIAIARGTPISLIGEFPPSVFWHLPQVTQYKNELEFFAFLNRPWSIED